MSSQKMSILQFLLILYAITEATSIGTEILRVVATDKDAGKDGDVLFSLISSFQHFPLETQVKLFCGMY